MTKARFLPLLNENQKFSEDAPLAMLGTMFFPKCTRSADHYSRIVREGAESGEPLYSEIRHLMEENISTRWRKGGVAGEVALRLVKLAVHGQAEPSLNKAIHLLVDDLQTAQTVDLKPWRRKSTSGVRQAFDDFRDVAHLWAAHSAYPQLYKKAHDDEGLARFLSVASVYEAELDKVGTLLWHPWRIPNALRGNESVLIESFSEEEVQILQDYHPALRS